MSAKIYKNGAWVDISDVKVYQNGAWESKDAIRVYENGAWVDKWVREVILDKGTIDKTYSSTSISYPDDYSVKASALSTSSGNRQKACTMTFWAEGTFVNPSISFDFGGNTTSPISDYCSYARVFADNQFSDQTRTDYYGGNVAKAFTGTFGKVGFELILYTSASYPVTNTATAYAFKLNDTKLRITARP